MSSAPSGWLGRGDDPVGEILIELKSLNPSFSSSNLSIRAFRAYPHSEIRQTVPCRAIRGNSSDSSRRYPQSAAPSPPLSGAASGQEDRRRQVRDRQEVGSRLLRRGARLPTRCLITVEMPGPVSRREARQG